MTDEIERVREAHVAALREAYGEGIAAGDEFYRALAKRLQPKPSDHGISEMEAGFKQLRQDNNDLRKRLDDLTQRLNQPKPTPAPKVWSVSEGTVLAFNKAYGHAVFEAGQIAGAATLAALNAIVDDMIRDRTDAVAKDWERRYRKAFPLANEPAIAMLRRQLFPEVEG